MSSLLQRASLVLFGLAVVVCTISAPSLVSATQPTSVPVDDPEALRDRLFELRSAEGARKQAFAEEQMRAEGLRSPNQDEWDVTHYDLDLTIDHLSNTLSGTVTTTATVLGSAITTFDLNLRTTMTISAITVNGTPVTWTHSGQLAVVTLDQTYVTDDVLAVAVTYSGNPAGAAFGWSSADGKPMIWSLSEPFGARSWWPCKDHNYDKADSLDMRLTVRDPLIAVSNGSLVSTAPAAGWTTYHWHSDYAINTYLVSLAIHEYTTFSHQYTPLAGGDPMPVDYYVFASNFNDVQSTYALTVPMIEAFAYGYGEYPFVDEKYGHAEFTWGGGMEHQTISSMGGHSEDLISHELAHQWWGDMITCASFHHIWLNEGFATWSEAYWKEQDAGVDTYRQYMDAAAYYGPGTITIENIQSDNIFDVNLTYNKASWIPHMVRGILGDEDFFAGLAHYRDLYQYSSATTEQFRDAMEFVSGKDLDAFFQQWIYGEYFPVYSYTWSEPTAGNLELVIEQTQTNTGLFTMPITVRVHTSAGTEDHVVDNSLASETYNIAVAGTVESVQLDPDGWILRQVESFVTNPTFDAGILVVNGVDWATYDPEIQSAFADSVFWDDFPFTFWDNFPEPVGGYPANVPAPLGHGAVPAGVLGDFSAVVWVGNNYAGDLPKWAETPIESYLSVGGNVLLLTRRGISFLDGSLSDYLGITWQSENVTLSNTTAAHTDFVDIPFTGTQSWNDVFNKTSLGPNSTLLFESTVSGQSRGSGAIVIPPAGGTHRADGGRLAYIAGRPYRMNHAALRANVHTILEGWFGEPFGAGVGIDDPQIASGRFLLSAGTPNPFRASTALTFSLPAAASAQLAVYDVSGRLVRALVSGEQPAGERTVTWDGTNEQGQRAAAGVYFVKLQADQQSQTQPIVRLR